MHCLHECSSKPHFGHCPVVGIPCSTVPHCVHRETARVPGQIDGPRSKTVISFRRWSPAWLFSATLSRLVIAILISMLSIFCRHKLLPSTRRIVYPMRDLPQVSSNLTGRLSCGGGFLCGPVIIACSEGISRLHQRQGSSYNNGMIHEIFRSALCNATARSSATKPLAKPWSSIQAITSRNSVDRQKHNLQVKQIVITHAHIDHVGGAMKLRAATGAPILLNQNDYDLLQMLDAQAAWVGMPSPGKGRHRPERHHGETVTAGSLIAQILHTPGHTEGSICLYFAAEKKLIAGDTLFAGSIGRTDLPGGSMQKILSSLHNTLLALPDETVVIPGHGPLTTIGEERETNPFLVRK